MANAKVIATAMMVAVMLTPAPSRVQQCLHKAAESDDERARREAAARFVARVNALQAQSQQERGTYAPLEAGGGLSDVPVGFVPRLVFNQWSYLLSVKDLFDPCGFSLFSDEHGVIYEAHPTVPAESPSPASQVIDSASQVNAPRHAWDRFA